jgi:inhibitor of cysteine peptidase
MNKGVISARKGVVKMKKSLVLALTLVLVFCVVAGATAYHYVSSDAATPSRHTSMSRFGSPGDFIEAFRRGSTAQYATVEKSSSPTSRLATGATSSEGPGHSTTNVQVAGVDEADIVKNDGKYLYAISGQALYILLAYPPEKAKVLSKVECGKDSSLTGMYIEGDRLVVIGTNNYHEPKLDVPIGACLTFIAIYDITDRAKPELVRNIEYEGCYSTSRMVDGHVYVVLTTYPEYVVYEKKDPRCSDIIPAYRDTRKGQVSGGFAPACGYRDIESVDPKSFSSFLSILTVSLPDGGDTVDRKVIAGSSENAYASSEYLYVVGSEYGYQGYLPQWGGEDERTAIHKFKLDGPRTTYVTSAEVPGTVLNQFSMDESNGYFRIATTRGHVSREGSTSTNNVYVLDGDLKTAGRLEGLAPGERIYSARFIGNRAYLVTFKKVDPFFVLDLADPGNPRVLGALKIPGYSDYLHPYDENHVIGIGKNTVEANPEDGNFAWYQGMKIALFDVSDVANPREMYKVEIGDRGTDSYALNDQKAFLFDRQKNLLVLPVLLAEMTPEQKASPGRQANDYGQYTYQGAYVYDISLAGGIRLRGRITHLSDPSELTGDYYYYDSKDAVTRSLYIGNSLYTISEVEVKINNLDNLAEQASVRLGD